MILALSASALCAASCVSIQAIEPVIEPPVQFRGDVDVTVEFVAAGFVGVRCAERGAKFMGLPALNAGACADSELVSMVDPCQTLTAGPYADDLCRARAAALGANSSTSRGLEDPARRAGPGIHPVSLKSPRAVPADISNRADRTLRVRFVSPDDLAKRCPKPEGAQADASDARFCLLSGYVAFANPCRSENPGWYERTLCHELAHVNGWPADHPLHNHTASLPLARESPEALAWAGALQAP